MNFCNRKNNLHIIEYDEKEEEEKEEFIGIISWGIFPIIKDSNLYCVIH